MKRTISKKTLPFIIGFLLLIASSCEKDNNETNEFNDKTSAVFNPQITYGSMTDQDGNTYKTVTIGKQIWMAENLRTTKFRNGEKIILVTDSNAWKNSSSAAYCNYKNSSNIDTIATYGRLYNGYVISDSRNIAPEGWHVPSDEEWAILIEFLGGDTVAGCKLKEDSTKHWQSPNKNVTNETGYTALPAGYRSVTGDFLSLSYYTQYWSSTVTSDNLAQLRSMYYFSNDIGKGSVSLNYGFSIRCVKDK
jgi:uncharacterized protein (TIGR02145 family)